MTTFIIIAIVLIGGWFGFRMLIKRARAAQSVTGLTKKQVIALEGHLEREVLEQLRKKAEAKVADNRKKALEQFYYEEYLKN